MWRRLKDMEPARLFAGIRGLVYILVGVTGSWLSPENVEPILGVMAGLLGVDVVTNEIVRNGVTPNIKVPKGKGGK